MVKVRENLIGKRFGRLVVIDRADDYVSPKGWREAQWLCQCDCGNTKIVNGKSLKQSITKSCGCYNKERSIETKRKYNEYDLTSCNYGIGYATNNGQEFYFDLEDYEKIKIYGWRWDGRYIHTIIRRPDGSKTVLRLHVYLMGTKDGLVVDHINRIRYDNRKENLRFATYLENARNSDRYIKKHGEPLK